MREQLPPLAPTGKPKLPVQVTSLPGDRLTRVPPPPLRRCPVRLLPSSDRAPKYATVSGSSLGVPQRPPLHRHPRVRPLLGCPRAQGCHTLDSFRPRRSSRPRRFPPHTAPQVCCTLQPVMGFARFRATRRHCCRRRTLLRSVSSPSKLFRRTGRSLSPGPCPPRRWKSVCRSIRLPRPRGVLSSPEFHHSAFPPVHELPWGSLDPGFHLDPPSPAGPATTPKGGGCPVPL